MFFYLNLKISSINPLHLYSAFNRGEKPQTNEAECCMYGSMHDEEVKAVSGWALLTFYHPFSCFPVINIVRNRKREKKCYNMKKSKQTTATRREQYIEIASFGFQDDVMMLEIKCCVRVGYKLRQITSSLWSC